MRAIPTRMPWTGIPNESATVSGPSVLDPGNFRAEYGTSNLDVRHSASRRGHLGAALEAARRDRRILNGRSSTVGWSRAIGAFHSGLPYTMRTAGSLAKEFDTTGTAIVALAPGMNGYGGDNRVYGVGRNTYRYPATWKADMRLAKQFNLGCDAPARTAGRELQPLQSPERDRT